MARWLLTASDRGQTNILNFSQEFLASMLGSTRTAISLAANRFKKAGWVKYGRRDIELLDKTALEECACECYCVVKDHLNNYTDKFARCQE
jgi:hypothetical protein